MSALNATHDPALRSWVESANVPGADFPLQNLPFAAFRRAGSAESFRGGVAIGDCVLDLGALQALGVLDGLAAQALALCSEPVLNAFMRAGHEVNGALRAALSVALSAGSPHAARLRPLLIPQSAVEYRVAAQVGDFTDFYASIYQISSATFEL